MTTAETLRALIALVEEAKAGSRKLDEAIHGALLPNDPWWQAILEGRRLVAAGQEDTKIDACNCNLRADSWATGSRVYAYTTSIDAALALVAKVLPGWIVERMSDQASGYVGALKTFGAHVELEDGEKTAVGQAVTRPLAILAALLRALLQQSETAHVER